MWRSRALRSPMSRFIEEMPTTVPASSRIGATLAETSISRPSLWRRTTSACTVAPERTLA